MSSRQHHHRATDKPQGFGRAQMAKKGVHDCNYECDRLFSTSAEAKRHADADEECQKKREAFEALQTMAEAKGFCDKRSSSKLSKAERKTSERNHFVDYLNGLPDSNRLTLVEWAECSKSTNT